MPRKTPDTVIEHRLSLQDAERKALLEPIGQILNDTRQFTEQANQIRQIATLGALGLGVGALVVLPKVWSTTARLIAGAANTVGDLGEDINEFLDSPFKTTFKKLDKEAKDFTKWLFNLDDLPAWADRS